MRQKSVFVDLASEISVFAATYWAIPSQCDDFVIRYFSLHFRSLVPSSRGLGHRPFTAVTRVQIPLGTLINWLEISWFLVGPVAQLVSAPPCHGGGRGFKSRLGRDSVFRLGSSVGTSVRLKIVRSTVRSRPQPHGLLPMAVSCQLENVLQNKFPKPKPRPNWSEVNLNSQILKDCLPNFHNIS